MTAPGSPAVPLRILALGDSYAIGEAVAETERWPNQLARQLEELGIATAPPTIIATTGWTTDELSAAIDRAAPVGPFDLVTLLIGVNNQYRGRSVEEFAGELRSLVERAIAFASNDRSRVLAISIPDWGVTPFASGRDRARIAEEIDRFNDVVRAEADRWNVRFVDVTPISRRAAHDVGLVAEDGLHPSGRMYRDWCEVIRPAALAALQRF